MAIFDVLGLGKRKDFREIKISEEEDRFYQNIILHIENPSGKIHKIVCSVKAFVFSEEEIDQMVLKKIQIASPKKLPEDCRFSEEGVAEKREEE